MSFRIPLLCSLVFWTIMMPAAGQTANNASPLRPVSRTLYSDKTELFAEFRTPLVVGQATRLTAHLTKLGETFQAYSEGRVGLTLSVDEAAAEAQTDAPERPGVFRLVVTPTKAGQGRIVIELVIQGSAERFVIEGIPVYASTEAALAKQTPAETGLISYAKEKSWEGGFATAPVRKRGSSLVVARTALIQDQGTSYVYLQRTPEAFEMRAVKTGASSGEYTEIAEGLREGDRIVSRGADKMPRK